MRSEKLLIVFMTIGLVLVGCSKKGNNPEAKSNDQTQKQEQKTIQCTIQYFFNDSLLKYFNYSIVDSLHLEEGEIPGSIASLDTLTSDFWVNTMSIMYHCNPSLYTTFDPNSIQVITLSRDLVSGSYQYYLRLTLKERLSYPTSIPVLMARYATSTIKKWSYQSYFDTNELFFSDLSNLDVAQQSMQVFVSF